jgi:hypothetical protein
METDPVSETLSFLVSRVLTMNNAKPRNPSRDVVTGGWRKLLNEELHDLCSSPSIIRMIKSWKMRWSGHIARMGERMNTKRPLARPKHGWVDNIKTDLQRDRNSSRSVINCPFETRSLFRPSCAALVLYIIRIVYCYFSTPEQLAVLPKNIFLMMAEWDESCSKTLLTVKP